MKPIKLTEDQKSRLLEMCEALFPEYHEWCFYHTISKANMIVAFKKENDSDLYDNCDIFIHWFEFCMTHLAEKILLPGKPSRNQKEIFCNFFWESNVYWYDDEIENLPDNLSHSRAKHPVDYLYNEFKKLKSC